MRFHSVVFQCLLSGKNAILDYTDPEYGKISGFLKEIDPDNYYNIRYYNLQGEEVPVSSLIPKRMDEGKFQVETQILDLKLEPYLKTLEELG